MADINIQMHKKNANGTYDNIFPKANASFITDGLTASIIHKYTHSKSGTVHTLTLASGGNSIEFLATADYVTGDTFVVNGTTITSATTSDGEVLTDGLFKNGNYITGIRLNGAKLNFKSGGGSYGTLAAQINNFYATIGNASVALTWANPSDTNFVGVAIIRKTGSYPTKVSDGTKIYEGSLQAFTDTGLTNGTQYYYRAFAYNAKKEYQTEYCVATMTPQKGNPLGSMPVGTKIKFGSIFGNPIVQTIANKSGSDITLITDGLIATYAYDAKEPLNGDATRQSSGNNRYIYSNIHQWLNSTVASGWFANQHAADQAPSSSYVSACPYDMGQGFLSGFSAKEKNYLKTKTITVGKTTTDGAGTETINALMWLPSVTEVGLSSGFTEGTQLSLFSDNASRIAKCTVDCANHTSGTANVAENYWLRSPHTSVSGSASYVGFSSGSLSYNSCYTGNNGIRPCCVLDTSVLISLTADANGYYSIL